MTFLANPPPQMRQCSSWIDEDGIDNDGPYHGSALKFFNDVDVNDNIADIGLRAQLPFFANNVDKVISLYSGEVGDEGWFALETIPAAWDAAGPEDNGLLNFLGVSNPVGPGLGAGDDPEAHLDKVSDVTPLRALGLAQLVGKQVCALVFDSDISTNYDPLDGSS